MKHLYYVRHGETVMNVERRHAGHFDTPLTENGIAQAQAAGEAAQSLHIDYIISSPLSRALDTAKIMAATIGIPEQKIEINNLAIERDVGSMQGQSWDLPENALADAETEASVQARAGLLLEHIRQLPADTVLVISHGGFGRALWRAVNAFDNPSFEQIEFGNAEIVQLI